jgi:glycosyltransferase involved in cell wall biosynthesis
LSQSNRRMNVMHLIQSSSGGGAEAVTRAIAQHQTRHFNVSMLTWEDEFAFNIPEGVHHVKLSRKYGGLRGLLSLAKGVRSAFKQSDVDAVISHLPYTAVVSGLASINLQIGPKIFVHHSSLSKSPGGLPAWLVKRIYRMFQVVSVSEDSAKSLSKFVHRSKIRVLPNPLNLVTETRPAKALGLQSKINLLAVGRLAAVKNYPFMLEAVALIDRDFELSIIGDGDPTELKAIARNLGIEHRVKFLGWLEPAEISKYFLSHDIFLMTSEYEGEPSSLLEAAAAGLNVVGRDTPGLGKAVLKVGGITPALDNPDSFADSVKALISSQTATIADRDWIEKHNPIKASHAYCELIKEIEA